VAEEGVVFDMRLLVVNVVSFFVLFGVRGPQDVLVFAIPLQELCSPSSLGLVTSAVALDKNKLGVEQDRRIDFANVTQLLEQT
jgi:hypothetical protein